MGGVRGGLVGSLVETRLPTEHCILPPSVCRGNFHWSDIHSSFLSCVGSKLGSILSFLQILSLGHCLPAEKTLSGMGALPQTQCNRAAPVHAGDTVWSSMIYGRWVSWVQGSRMSWPIRPDVGAVSSNIVSDQWSPSVWLCRRLCFSSLFYRKIIGVYCTTDLHLLGSDSLKGEGHGD